MVPPDGGRGTRRKFGSNHLFGAHPGSLSAVRSEKERENQEGKGMDVKGAKALSERLAEATRNVDLPPKKAEASGDNSDRTSEVADTTAKG